MSVARVASRVVDFVRCAKSLGAACALPRSDGGRHTVAETATWMPSSWIPRRCVSCPHKPPGDLLLAIAAKLGAGGGEVVELPTGPFAC